MDIRKVAVASTLVLASFAPAARAGVYTDDLSRCLVESTTQEDRVDLVVWMFTAASAHPAVKPLSTVSEEQIEAANQRTAELAMRLVTESCREQAKKAVKFEGAATFEASFQVLGQVAGQELFSSPEVVGALAGLEKHFDSSKLEALLDPE